MINRKINYMDIVKTIGIILVVIGHSGFKFANFIYLFHMALFFFVSGYFYKDFYTENIRCLLIRRIKNLYIPFVVWEIIFLTFHNILYTMHIYSDKVSIYEFFIRIFKNITFGGTEQLLGTFWFIISLFTINITFAISRFFIICKLKKSEKIYALFIIILFFIGKNTNFPRLLSVSMVATSIFYIGYIYKKIESHIVMDIRLAIVSFIILYINNMNGSISIGANEYTNTLFFITSSICGIYIVIWISKKHVYRLSKSHWLKYISENTFIIMTLHFLAFKIITFIQIKLYKFPIYKMSEFPVIRSDGYWWILYSLIGIFMPITLKFYFEKVWTKIKKIKYS